MKTLVVVLILLSFLQVTVVPVNMVLIVLILRAYLFPEKENLYLAFIFGLFISYLESQNIGVYSIIYLFFIQIIQLFRKAPFSKHFLVMIPAVTALLALNFVVQGLLMKSSVHFWPGILKEVLLILPVYFILKIWEEKFVIKPEVKIRV